MPNNKLIYLLMVLVAFFWGGTFNAAGFALADFHPLTIAFLRFAIATVILLLIGRREIFSTPVKKKDWLNFFLLGLTGIFAYNAFFLYAMKYTSPINGSLIVAINPIVTAILAALLLKEKFTTRLAGGALISIIGVVLVISEGSWQIISSLEFNFGDILTLGSVISWSLYAIVGKTVSDSFSPLITTFYGFLTGTLIPVSYTHLAVTLHRGALLDHGRGRLRRARLYPGKLLRDPLPDRAALRSPGPPGFEDFPRRNGSLKPRFFHQGGRYRLPRRGPGGDCLAKILKTTFYLERSRTR